MRVIGGEAGGRKLLPPRDRNIRPTSDRVKEAIFNILVATLGSLQSRSVMDVCSGTGALGIEALSRGAERAVFIDSSKEAIKLIRQNLTITGLVSRAEIRFRDAVAALRAEEIAGNRFDLIFLDPPYASGVGREVLSFLGSSALIHPDSLVVAEFASRDPFADVFGNLRQYNRRVYGDTAVSFLKLDTTG